MRGQTIYAANISGFPEIQIKNFGHEYCEKGKTFGPHVRNRYIIHYILDGYGTFDDGERVYNLSRGNAFLIVPDKVTIYSADKKIPWEYMWFEFSGGFSTELLRALNVSEKNPIYKTKKCEDIQRRVAKLFSTIKKEKNEFAVMGVFLELIGSMADSAEDELPQKKPDSESYVRYAKEYIENNYHRNVTVAELCAAAGFERSHFFRLFRSHTGVAPKEYILNVKIKKAIEYMKNPSLNLSQIAYSVGFSSEASFSKAFKARSGISPKKFRELYIG